MESTISELWQEYSRKYLDRYGERPTMRISDRNTLIIALIDLENYDADQSDSEFDDSGEVSFD